MSKKEGSKKEKEAGKKQSSKGAKPSQESQQLRRAKEKEALDILNRENVQKYLKKLQEAGTKDELVGKYGLHSIVKITQSLENGSLIIPENSSPLPQKTPLPPKLTFDELKEMEVKAKRENIVKKIEYFYEQIRGENHKPGKKDNQPVVEFKEILTREEHERRVREIMQEKEDRQKRLQQLQDEEEKRVKEEEEKAKSEREAQQLKAKEEKRRRIQETMAKRKEMHEKLIQSEAKEAQKPIKRPKLYEQMEEKYKSQILMPYLEEKKNKLKQLRDFKKQYELDAIRQHQKQYLQKSLQKSREKKAQPEWKYDPPYKTERLTKALQEEQMQLKSQLQARKRRIEDMQSRQELFNIDLREKYRPKIDEAKRKEVESRISEEKREKVASAAEQRELGISYLQIAKKLKRSQSVKNSEAREGLLSNPSSLKSQTRHSLSRLKNHSQQYYQDFRRRKIDDIVNSEQSSANEKYLMLRIQADKLGQRIRQKQTLMRNGRSDASEKQAAQLMLSSIKAKMGLMSVLRGEGRKG